MKWLVQSISENPNRLDIYLFSSGILGSIGEWMSDNQEILRYWIVIAVPLVLARMVPLYQSYLDAKQNRRLKKMERGFELMKQYPDQKEEIGKQLNL